MENGRFMTGPFGWLVSRCEARKRAWGDTYFGLDSCMVSGERSASPCALRRRLLA